MDLLDHTTSEAMVLSVSLDTIRLFLHVLAATIWVGGQLTLGALVPVLRGIDGVTKTAARRFNQVAWPAFGVLIATGVWNMLAVHGQTSAYKTTLNVKMTLVLLSGVSAYLHTRASSKKSMAIWGALSALTAVATLFVGIMLGNAPTTP
jgi:putative copper export protein